MESFGFGTRRKRNIDLGNRRNESTLGINWGPEIDEIVDNAEVILPHPSGHTAELPDDNPRFTESNSNHPHFGEGYQKVTVYLPTELFKKIKLLKKTRYISSYIEFLTTAARTQFTNLSQ